MGGTAQVGGGAFVGYNPEQGDRPIGGEPKYSSQSQDPQLSKQVRVRNRIWASHHCQSAVADKSRVLCMVRGGCAIFGMTTAPWPADRGAQACGRCPSPSSPAQLHLHHTISSGSTSSPLSCSSAPTPCTHDMCCLAGKNQNIWERWAVIPWNHRREL